MNVRSISKQDLKQWAFSLGIELLAVTDASSLASGLGEGLDRIRFRSLLRGEVSPQETMVDRGVRPEQVSERLQTVVVVGKRLHAGIAKSHDRGLRRLAAGNIVNRLDHATARLGYDIEAHGALAMLMPSLLIEWDREDATHNTPAGQGSMWARTAAVVAGLGTWGLNEMVLTPEFGPRVYFSTLLTDLELPADPPMTDELCWGLPDCGKCAQVCPADAIPKQAPAGASFHQYRGLDRKACATCSQPYGPDAFVEFFREIFLAEGQQRQDLIHSATTHELWQHMTLTKFGAYTGCIDCLTVCPVGADFDRIGETEA